MLRARLIAAGLHRAAVTRGAGAVAVAPTATLVGTGSPVPNTVSRFPFGSTTRALSQSAALAADKIPIYFQNSAGDSVKCMGRVGETLLEIAIDNDIDLEGACGGTLACSTCHVYIPEDLVDSFPEMEEEEEDMLDLAVAVKDNSRLGCQCEIQPKHAEMVVTLAEEYSDAR